jgi:hypothetical protein
MARILWTSGSHHMSSLARAVTAAASRLARALSA